MQAEIERHAEFIRDRREWVRRMVAINNEVLDERRKDAWDQSITTPEHRAAKATLMGIGTQLFNIKAVSDRVDVEEWISLVDSAASLMFIHNMDPMTLFLEFSENPSATNWNRLYAAMAVTQAFSLGDDQ